MKEYFDKNYGNAPKIPNVTIVNNNAKKLHNPALMLNDTAISPTNHKEMEGDKKKGG